MEEGSVFPETALASFRGIVFTMHILTFSLRRSLCLFVSISSRIKTLRLEKSLNLQQMTAGLGATVDLSSKVGVANFARQ